MLSTAHTPTLDPFQRNRVLHVLTAAYAAVWIWAAINPLHFDDWLLENVLVVAAVIFTAWLWHKKLLSDLSSVQVAIFLALHTVGSHYTYSLVPFGDWLKDAMEMDRNHYDRIIHFTFGLLIVYPMREFLARTGNAMPRWPGLTAFFVIATASGIYELIEWLAAVIVSPETGAAFLGTQGDEFDAQKDHALALVGAVATLALARFAEGKAPAPVGQRPD